MFLCMDIFLLKFAVQRQRQSQCPEYDTKYLHVLSLKYYSHGYISLKFTRMLNMIHTYFLCRLIC